MPGGVDGSNMVNPGYCSDEVAPTCNAKYMVTIEILKVSQSET